MERDHYDPQTEYDDIGYEAGRVIDPNGEIQSYSHRDMEVIGKFVNILNTKHQLEDQMRASSDFRVVTYQDGEKKKALFPLTESTTYGMSMIAFNMYKFYGQEPHMKEAFDQVTHGMKVDQELQRQTEIQELNNLWSRP